jgi:hypothetical protein
VNTPLQPRAAHAVLLEGPLDVRLSAGPEPQLADPQAFAPPATVQHLLVRTEAARLDSFACRAGLQPQLVRQFVAYGLLDPGYARPSSPGAAPPGTSPPVSGAGAVLVLLDLVDRVHALEASVAGRGVGGPDITNGRGGA